MVDIAGVNRITAPAALLEASQLSYHVQGRKLINDVSLHIASGEMVAIIGPNGAGKSTLLRLLTGYLPPQMASASCWGKTSITGSHKHWPAPVR